MHVSKKRRDPQTEFGWYLRRLMDARGFETDGDLQLASGLDASVISRWQAGGGAPTVQNLRKIAGPLGVHLGDLMVAAGLATKAELGMEYVAPPPPPILDKALQGPAKLLRDEQIPDVHKDKLRDLITAAVDFWYKHMGVVDAPHEPSAAERASGRNVTKG